MIRSDNVQFGKDGSTVQGGSKILNMWDGVSIAIGCSDAVQGMIVSTWSPISVLFGTICNGNAQLLDDGHMIPSCNMWSNSWRATRSLSGESLRAWEWTGGPEVEI